MTSQNPPQSLQGLLDSVPSLVDHLYGNRKGSVLKDAVLRQPTQFVAPEFTNWRDEQMACRTSIAFYDQSFHMTTTFLRGKDAVALMNHLCVNSFGTFGVDRSRHTVMCSPEGDLIGDGILYCLAPDELALVGRQAGHNWVRFNAQTGDWTSSSKKTSSWRTTRTGVVPSTGIRSKDHTRRRSCSSSPVRRCPRCPSCT